MITNEFPETFVFVALGHEWRAKLIYTEDKWWIFKIFYTLYGQQKEACGRGRSPKVAEKFATQALEKGLT